MMLVCCPKGFGAQSASPPSGSVNTKNRFVEVEGIFVNNTGARQFETQKRATDTASTK